MRAVFVDKKLYISKVYHMKINRAAVAGNLSRQIHHLLFGSLTCIGRCMEIDRINLDASFGNHIACHWRVNSTGEKKHSFACRSNRHPTRPRNHLRVQVDPVTDLYRDGYLRVVHIYL